MSHSSFLCAPQRDCNGLILIYGRKETSVGQVNFIAGFDLKSPQDTEVRIFYFENDYFDAMYDLSQGVSFDDMFAKEYGNG